MRQQELFEESGDKVAAETRVQVHRGVTYTWQPDWNCYPSSKPPDYDIVLASFRRDGEQHCAKRQMKPDGFREEVYAWARLPAPDAEGWCTEPPVTKRSINVISLFRYRATGERCVQHDLVNSSGSWTDRNNSDWMEWLGWMPYPEPCTSNCT